MIDALIALVAICALCLFLEMPWVGLQSVIVALPGQTHLHLILLPIFRHHTETFNLHNPWVKFKILNFRNANLKTCRMPIKFNNFKFK